MSGTEKLIRISAAKTFGVLAMIRLISTLLLAIIPFIAHAASKEDYARALEIFLGSDKNDPSTYMETYAAHVAANLQGRWVPATGLDAAAFSDELLKNYCRSAASISDVTTYGFTLTQGREGGPQVHSKFRLFSGNTFVQYSDPQEVLAFFGMNTEGLSELLKVETLSNTSGLATVIRFGEDILVMQRNYGPPQIFIRCKQ